MVSRTVVLGEKGVGDFQQTLEWGTDQGTQGERVHRDLLIFYGAYTYQIALSH